MQQELTLNEGNEKNARSADQSNSCNGSLKKTIISDSGNLEIKLLRNLKSEFEPKIIRKKQNR